jgi:hypothetical protein
VRESAICVETWRPADAVHGRVGDVVGMRWPERSVKEDRAWDQTVADARRSCQFPDELGFGSRRRERLFRPRPQHDVHNISAELDCVMRCYTTFSGLYRRPPSCTMASSRGAAAPSGWFMQVRHSLRPSTLHNAPGRTPRYCDLAR